MAMLPSETKLAEGDIQTVSGFDPSEIRVGDEADIPSAGTKDRLFFVNDTRNVLRDTGSGWREVSHSRILPNGKPIFFGADGQFRALYDQGEDALIFRDGESNRYLELSRGSYLGVTGKPMRIADGVDLQFGTDTDVVEFWDDSSGTLERRVPGGGAFWMMDPGTKEIDFAGTSMVDGNTDIYDPSNGRVGNASQLAGKTRRDLLPPFFDGSQGAHQFISFKHGGEGSETSSQSFDTIASSDVTLSPTEFKDPSGNLFVRWKYHLQHQTSSGQVKARVYRQNAGTAVTGSSVSATLQGWTIQKTDWVDFSNESEDSFQVQLQSGDGDTVRYNSIQMILGVPT